MIPTKILQKARKQLKDNENRIYFYDDDADGSCSYLHLYKHYPGMGIIVKDGPELTEKYWQRIEQENPNLIVILDKPMTSIKLLNKARSEGIPVIYVDHHPPVEVNDNVTYINPRVYDDSDSRSTMYWAAQLTQKVDWLALAGTIADYTYAEDYIKEYAKQRPDLITEDVKDMNEAMNETKIGLLGSIINSNVRGKVKGAIASINALKRIESPDEILQQTTRAGKYVWKKYAKYKEFYDQNKKNVEVTDQPIIYYKYADNDRTVSAQLATEFGSKYPNKAIVIAREVDDEIYFSIRCQALDVSAVLQESLAGLKGRGGGHKHAVGASLRKEDAELFVKKFKELIKEKLKP